MEKQRKPYRPDQRIQLQRIESNRIRLGVTRRELCDVAGISASTYFRMCKNGRGLPRVVKGLTLALRTIQANQKASDMMFSLIKDS